LTPAVFRCGFCHQRAFLVAKALRRGGVSSAKILGLDDHVVASIEVDGTTYALDPDFGVDPLLYDGKHDDEIARAYKAVIPDFPAISNLVIHAYLTRDDNLKISVKNAGEGRATSIESHPIGRDRSGGHRRARDCLSWHRDPVSQETEKASRRSSCSWRVVINLKQERLIETNNFTQLLLGLICQIAPDVAAIAIKWLPVQARDAFI
jgi:hypothetical protein